MIFSKNETFIINTMKKNYIHFVFLFLLCSTFLQAQKLTGYVYDKNLKEPIWDATIYVDGTSYNTITDVNGRFELSVSRQINAPLVVRHIGYDEVVLGFRSELPDTIYLQEKTTQLEEIVVLTGGKERFSRERKLSAFRNQFLGLTDGGKSSRILNEDDIRLIYDSRNRLLTATADVPILIENDYLGYRVQFNLKEFRVTYRNNSLRNSGVIQAYYLGTSFFDEHKVNPNISENRAKTYENSINNFIKNLYLGTLDESMFIVEKEENIISANDCFSIEHTPSGAIVGVKHIDLSQGVTRLDVFNGRNHSQIRFLTDTFSINHFHITSPTDKVVFSGHMGEMRVGDSLPSDLYLE